MRTSSDGFYIASHPSLALDVLAAPWIHLTGFAGGLRELGCTVVIARHTALERLLARGGRGPAGALARALVEVVAPWGILSGCLRTRLIPYVRHYYDLAPAYFALSLARRPFVVEVNATLREEPHGVAHWPAWARRLAAAAELNALKRADAVIAVSSVLRARLVELGLDRERIAAVHNGARCDPGDESATHKGGRDVLYVGNFKPWHRVELLLESFARVAADTDDRLILVGSGDSAQLRDRASSLGLGDRVDFLGRRSREEVARLMRRALSLVLPNTEDYGSPLKVFEYLASGRPVILPDLPNIREVVEDRKHALLFEPGNVEALAEALRFTLSDPEACDALGKRGRALVCTEYTWARCGERVIEAVSSRWDVACGAGQGAGEPGRSWPATGPRGDC